MTKTTATPKISFITPSSLDRRSIEERSTTPEGDDAFVKASSNMYATLVSGRRSKAESIDGGVLEDMYNAESQNTTVPSDYYSRVQQMLGGLMTGEVTERKPQDSFGKIPYVPNLQNDILKDTNEFHDNMEPVVERYAGLEKVLVSMYNEVNQSLRPSRMSEFSAGQLRSLKAYRAKLDEQLATCREQLSLSQKYLRAEITRAREELKAAEAEEASA